LFETVSFNPNFFDNGVNSISFFFGLGLGFGSSFFISSLMATLVSS